jgi:hypothetical protein
MAITSLREIFEAAAALPESARAVWAEVSSAFDAGEVTAAQLRHLVAQLRGLLDETKAIRVDLDGVDAEDFLRGTHPDQLIGVWQGERETRRQLVKMAGGFLDLIDTLERLDTGDARSMYVSRDGDTLQSIAAAHLGSWQEWPKLLDANPEISPGPLASGTLVIIPARR